MKVYLLRWVFDRGGYDQCEDVIGIYIDSQNAITAGVDFVREYGSNYTYAIEEMTVHA